MALDCFGFFIGESADINFQEYILRVTTTADFYRLILADSSVAETVT